MAENIYKAFPSPELMVRKKSLREYKYIAAQMNSYEPILEEIIYAFQAPEVVAIVEDIVGVFRSYGTGTWVVSRSTNTSNGFNWSSIVTKTTTT